MTTLSKLVGKRIKELREEQNIKQNELAEMIDMEPTNLSKIEKGIHLPKDDKLEKIFLALCVNIEELFYSQKRENPKTIIRDINLILNQANLREIQTYYEILKTIEKHQLC